MVHRAEHAGCALRLASQASAGTQLQDQAAHAQAELTSCQAELAHIGAAHQREVHAKDTLIAQLKAALTAEEAARASAVEHLRNAQQGEAHLQVCNIIILVTKHGGCLLAAGSHAGPSGRKCM